MIEETITIPVDDGVRLEARHARGSGAGWAVVSHPHPLYGGSMDNNVVSTACAAAQDAGLATLRFNFRGVGRSTGDHGGGDAEVEDLLAAMALLRERYGEGVPGHLVGYSFGAWVTMKTLPRCPPLATLTLISPPLDFLPLGAVELGPQPTLVVAGERDDFCSVGTLQHWIDEIEDPPEDLAVRFLKYGDHFYSGRERELGHELGEFFAEYA